jgi:cyclopropane-fatty-acyl-phospholipid synthase
MRQQGLPWVIDAAERGLPDRLIRAGVRRVVRSRLTAEATRPMSERDAMLRRWQSGPVALVPDLAREQHYEVPAAFFELVLGPRLKYSSGWWGEGIETLSGAEEAMLGLTAERAGVEDGMRVLDLGCGWGSLSLWMAERYPGAEIVAVSNSVSQGDFIRRRAEERGLRNVEHHVIDVNHLEVEGRFDLIVSVELLEHVRNHPALLQRLRTHLEPGASVFIHVFAHRSVFWEFEDRGPGDWMARHFFTGGIMPGHEQLGRLVAPHHVETSWWIDGFHYARTLDAWLDRLDARRSEVRAVFEGVYGPGAARWIQRWRMFFMASSEFFGWEGGGLLGVGHHRLRLE